MSPPVAIDMNGPIGSPGAPTSPRRVPQVVRYNVRYCPANMEGAWKYHTQPANGIIQIPGAEPGIQYYVEVQCVPDIGAPSDWVRVDHTVVGVVAPPPPPSNLVITPGADHNKISCTLPTQIAADVEVEFHWSLDNVVYTFLERGKGTETKDTYTSGQPRWYRARTIDYQGNVSDWIVSDQAYSAKTVEDGAQANAPTIGFIANLSDWGGASNPHEIFLHGYADGVAANVAGKIMFNGQVISIPAGQILTTDSDTTSSGFILAETNGSNPFLVESINRDVAFARLSGPQWQYDNNATWVNFTPSATMVVIGTCEKGPSGIKRVTALGSAVTPDFWGRIAAGLAPDGTVAQNVPTDKVIADAIYQHLRGLPGANLIINHSGNIGTRFWNVFGGASIAAVNGASGWVMHVGGMASGTGGTVTDIPIEANQPYSISGELYTNGLISGNIILDVVWLDSAFVQIGEGNQVTVPPGAPGIYIYYSAPNIVAPGGTAYARIRYFQEAANYANGGGPYIFRKLKFELGAVATPFSDEATQEGNRLTLAGSGVQLGDNRNVPPLVGANRTPAIVSTASTLSSTDGGATASVAVASHSRRDAGGLVNLNGGNVTGLPFGQLHDIYYDDQFYAGGSVSYVGTTDGQVVAANRNRLWVGRITTATNGGGGTGGGVDPVDCVTLDMYADCGVTVRDLLDGQSLIAMNDDGDLVGYRQIVHKGSPKRERCVTIRTERASVTCTPSTPVICRDRVSALPADSVIDQEVRVLVDGVFGWERVVSVADAGEQEIVRMSIGGYSYPAGREACALVFTHNETQKP